MKRTLALLLLGGCAPESEPVYGRFVERGEHIEVWASEGVEVCGGNVGHMDAFVDQLRFEVGPHPEAEDLRRFYVLDDEDWEDFDRCVGFACTVALRTIYSRLTVPSVHELTHGELGTGGHRFLEEGLAVMFGDPEIGGYPFETEVLDVFEEVEGSPNALVDFEAYPRAGHFTRFLVDRYGIKTFLDLKDASSRGMSLNEMGSLFDEHLGETLEGVLSSYGQHPVLCTNSGYGKALVECSLDLTPWSSETVWEVETSFVCSDDDVLGPRDGDLYVVRGFEVDELARFRFEVEGEGARAWFFKCDGECVSLPRDDGTYPYEPGEFALEVTPDEPASELVYPGRYWVRVGRSVEVPSGGVLVRVTLEP